MKNIILRLLLAAIMVPLLVLFMFKLTIFNHIGLALVFIIGSTLGAWEMARIFRNVGIKVSYTLSIINGFTIPVVYWLAGNEDMPAWLNLPESAKAMTITLLALLSLATEIINTTEEQWKKALQVLSANLMIMFYPAYLTTYILALGKLEYSAHVYFTFFLLVFVNDSMAYFTGMLLGRNTWKPFPISPNKSIAGFIGGFVSTIGAATVSYLLKPEAFNGRIEHAFTLGILISIAANTGDLVESSIKRSAGVKDSGKLMLGRGGILDSIDSLIFSAPVLYIFIVQFIQK